uniref:Regulator of telomere elongation helicase 1 homolog n=1 Tax=Anopheles epiroticus TaxID=199890 RepID=A0A182PWK2_9DIPT
MPQFVINGVSVNFPFEPYELQKNYMTKVIECLQKKTNGVLESPTGTGKTLSLLCSSMAWLLHMKSKQKNHGTDTNEKPLPTELSNLKNPSLDLEQDPAQQQHSMDAKIKIIYASRTHSQLSQAMQELKNTSYLFVRAIILGSRDQLCIHPEISRQESNAVKTTLCREEVKARNCAFYNRVESAKDRPDVTAVPVLDIEDLVTVGQKLKACPYFLSKELVEQADVIFMPYNYLLDPKARKSNGLSLQNSVIILDEAHNVEKMCEELGSTQLRSSDIALAIEDTSSVLKTLMDSGGACTMDNEKQLELTLDDVVLLKEILLNLEKVVDDIPIMFSQGGVTHPGTFVFELLEKANIKFGNINVVLQVINSLITYITTEKTNRFVRRGAGLQSTVNFLEVVYASSGPDYRQSIEKCFRVHIEHEGHKQSLKGGVKRADGWTATKENVKTSVKSASKVINFWCFNPGFGMRQLLDSGTRSIILTSGTLAPLKPFISELNLPMPICLENPHIIDRSQVYVKIISHGPDRIELNSSFKNRSNPEYISSLGRTALSLCPIIPGGLLIFFPSYPLLNKCSEEWQASGIWAQINRIKPIYVEPRNKELFTRTMKEYYAKVQQPGNRGAIFMAVCRGKVSEGLDFADANGRAVMITGLPFPPMMDARVLLKKQYLDINRTRENELITGNDWYALEASRAVNQAIGRVIRHKDDFGAILLCDSRFQNPRQQSQLSAWIHAHLKQCSNQPNFGTVVGEMSRFFRNMATSKIVPIRVQDVPTVKKEDKEVGNSTTGHTKRYKIVTKGSKINTFKEKFRLSEYLPYSMKTDKPLQSTLSFPAATNQEASNSGLVTMYKHEPKTDDVPASSFVTSEATRKKRKIVIVPQTLVKREIPCQQGVNTAVKQEPDGMMDKNDASAKRVAPENRVDFLREVKCSLDAENYKLFLQSLALYNRDSDISLFITQMCSSFNAPHLKYLLKAMRRFVKPEHALQFDTMLGKIMSDN